MLRFLRKKLNITLPLFGKMIPDFRNCWPNWQRTSIADRLKKAFKEYLLAKAEENFDEAVTRKGEHIMPDLFLSRGVYFLDKGDMQSAKKEFLSGLD
jgi:hypothetical protein